MSKINKRGGFTLAELLIVIAIIAILIAIAIPAFSAQLKNAKLNADHANMRSAYALVQTLNIMGDNAEMSGLPDLKDIAEVYYTTDGAFAKTGNPVTIQADGHNHDEAPCNSCVVNCTGAKQKDRIVINGTEVGKYSVGFKTPTPAST